ncbi:hypothetical protein [Saccharomonospora viridis]|jgi:hypothetical protein|uniref:Uncharacterized protein n=2 Tax=Saccharomonospora viridis TaxID=1852 RepID=C7MXD0_SACVD|nr:hypothetical protein [Saccharomonospora viridis]ACU95939.1 hypothetical protein Svir_08790 [Saccharomonospora viridis DSM 43017]KHF45566.1 hypothetical protein MINT15_07830 [Saccharomonospora viridis]SFP73919.1 hypothetical protein SAMN02982918_3219 [Saccharomonospora viridis]
MTGPDLSRDPRIAAAMAQLEQAELGLDRSISNAKQLEAKLPKSGLSQQDIEQITEHARSKDAPKELRELQARIDKGDLSWNDIAAGRFLDDPQVRKALEGGVEGMRQAYLMIQEGHALDDIIEPGGPSSSITSKSDAASPSTPQSTGEESDLDDDDYFGGSMLR